MAVSAITTFTTPFLIKVSPRFADRLERIMPRRWLAAIEHYSHQADQVKESSAWQVLLRAYIINLAVFGVLCLAIVIGVGPVLQGLFGDSLFGVNGQVLAGVATFLLVLPFIWTMSIRRIGMKAYRQLWVNKRQWRSPLVILELVRLGAAVVALAILVSVFFSTGWALVALLLLTAVVAFLFRQRLHGFYVRVEHRFFLNLNQRELSRRRTDLAPWDMHLAQLEVKEDSDAAGRSLQELALREKHGVNIAMIERSSGRTISAPGRDDRLLPGDNLMVIGTDEQLTAVQQALDMSQAVPNSPEAVKEDIRLKCFRITPQSPIVGMRLHDTGIKDEAKAMVAGLERGEQRITNPGGAWVLDVNDIVWLLVNGEKIRAFMEER